jgi:hypothetical protein
LCPETTEGCGEYHHMSFFICSGAIEHSQPSVLAKKFTFPIIIQMPVAWCWNFFDPGTIYHITFILDFDHLLNPFSNNVKVVTYPKCLPQNIWIWGLAVPQKTIQTQYHCLASWNAICSAAHPVSGLPNEIKSHKGPPDPQSYSILIDDMCKKCMTISAWSRKIIK